MNRKSTACVNVNLRRMVFRFRTRQENDMVDSAPQWEAVLRRQKEKNQADPNSRRSRHRSRSYVDSLYTFIQKREAWSSCRFWGRWGCLFEGFWSDFSSTTIIPLFVCHIYLCMFVTFINSIWSQRSWNIAKTKCQKQGYHGSVLFCF